MAGGTAGQAAYKAAQPDQVIIKELNIKRERLKKEQEKAGKANK